METIKQDRTIAVYRYALDVAAREDDFNLRQLGPIHLLKYAYLVDLEYAKYNSGRTFTGIEWIFHSFGPWSVPAHALIAVAMSVSNIQERRIPSGYTDDDFIRWSMDVDIVRSHNIGSDLPLEVRGALDRFVHKFGSDTSSLLHYVYATLPMLNAAPGDRLVFPARSLQQVKVVEPFTPLMEKLSKKQKKDFSARMTELKAAFEQRSSIIPSRSLTVHERLDSDYEATASWVNSLAGSPFPEGEVCVEFADSVWHSEARGGHADD